eukprot:TRINITY_DN472_c0_g1_i2.p1 TRINITY_DN472_c0_g1~~TRINITY_DN472_c0_g1_i2.p1  ORF type:complete len:245 (+),score=52.17 TRINITY_DN472_c0_g1_i2:669-1403(+)
MINRQTPALHAAYAAVYGEEALIVNHDRYGLFRPTQGEKGCSRARTIENLHLDMNPWEFCERRDSDAQTRLLASLKYRSPQDWIQENNYPGCAATGEVHVQALVNLRDNRHEDGGFWLVPHFREHVQEFVKSRPRRPGTFLIFSQDEEPALYMCAHRITARAGSAVLWDQRTLHGSKPNNSAVPRYAQFFKMVPVRYPAFTRERCERRRAAVLRACERAGIDPDGDLTSLGRRLFGIDQWDGAE